jgi:hypothetical protein
MHDTLYGKILHRLRYELERRQRQLARQIADASFERNLLRRR